MSLSHNRLLELVTYDANTGRFRAIKARPHIRVGQEIGHVSKYLGYTQMNLDGKSYYAHRLAWFYVNGQWPSEVDHINGDRTDNRINNLRIVNRTQNCQNQKRHKDNLTGYKNVWPRRGRFTSQIQVNKKRIYLGDFSTPEEAHLAYSKAAKEYFGEYVRAE